MARQGRKRNNVRSIVLIALVAALLISVIVVAATVLRRPSINMEGLQPLPVSNAQGVFTWQDGVICVDGTNAANIAADGSAKWQITLPEGVSEAHCSDSGSYCALWSESKIFIVNASGQIVVEHPLENTGKLLEVRCADSLFAVLMDEEGLHKIYIYDMKDKLQGDPMYYPDQLVMDFGFFTGGQQQLWTLALDSHGVVPVSRISTYNPGQSMTGLISLNDQVVYRCLPQEKTVYSVSAQYLDAWSYTGESQYSKLIYGWLVQDIRADNGNVTALLAPAGTEDVAAISSLWVINVNQTECQITLPSGCKRAMLGEEKIYVAADSGIYSMNLDGSARRFYTAPFYIDSVVAAVSGRALVVQSQGNIYMISLE